MVIRKEGKLPLNIAKKNAKEYLYFTVNGSKKLYLGTTDKPKEERIEEALRQLKSKIRKYENKVQELENLLQRQVPEFNIVYRLVIFDLDGVIFDKPWHDSTSGRVAVSTWDVLFQVLGMYDTHEKYKHKFENNGWPLMEWTEAACRVIKPVLDRKTFEKIIEQRPFMQGAKDVFKVLHEEKIITAVITGSFDALAQRASREFGGIDHIYAHTELHFNSNGSLERWYLKPSDYDGKVKYLKQVADDHSIPLAECAYIGDDVNDIEAFKEVGLSIAFNSDKPEVNQAAKVSIDSRDLKAILPHLCVKK